MELGGDMNNKLILCLMLLTLIIISGIGFNTVVEANNKFRFSSDKTKPDSNWDFKARSVYYEREAAELLREIRNQLVLEEKESVKLLREIRDMLRENAK